MPKTFDAVLTDFEKKHGLTVGTPQKVTALTTGNLAIDWQTGIGGIPRGRITELYGYEASGKTTTALMTAANLQRLIKDSGSDERIVYLDYEHALDVEYASNLGIDFDHPSFVPLQPNNLEQGASAALQMLATGKVPLVVFDSVAAMAPKRHKDGDFDQATIQMHRAKLISALCVSSLDTLHSTDCAMVFVNHRTEAIEMSGRPGLPPKTTTPGGRGLKFYASLRLEFDVMGNVRDKVDDFITGEEASQNVGTRVTVRCIKNKVAEPGKQVELRNRYGRGFDNAWSAMQVLIGHGLIIKAGAWMNLSAKKTPELTTEEKLQFHGENQFFERVENDPEWTAKLIDIAVRTLAGE